jgi:hypothetical protein
MGSVSGFTRASRARFRGASIASSTCTTIFDEVADVALAVGEPGFSAARGP